MAKLLAQGKEQPVKLFLILGIEVPGGFVGKDYGRIVDQGTCDGNPLFFPTRKLGRFVTFAGLQIQDLKQFVRPFFYFRFF